MEANRTNGRKSQGPRTQIGKRFSSKNALRHGLLSSSIVIDKGDGEESRVEFEDLVRGLLADLSPEGTLENLLVERIACCYWRLKRAIRCETGEVRKYLDCATFDGLERRLRNFKLFKSLGGCMQSSLGVERVIDLFGMAKLVVEDGDEIPEHIMKELYDHLGTDEDSPAILCTVFNNQFKKAKNSSSEDDKSVTQKTLLSYIATTTRNFRELLKELVNGDELRADSQLQSLSLPDGDAVERILRYETAIERQLYRALEQLERLQRQRKGDIVPPPLRLSIQR